MKRFRKVLILGFDGLDPRLMEDFFRRKELPKLAELRRQGGFACISTTSPAQTPVAWSTFTTGVNPGGHGIFDFIVRDPETYLPQIGLNRYEQKRSFLPPRVVNLQRAQTVWEILTNAGIPSTVLRCPCTYPPAEINGRMIAGMGVPDLRGSFGVSTFFTTDNQTSALESEEVVVLPSEIRSLFHTVLPGPRVPSTGRPSECELTVEVRPSERQLIIRSDSSLNALSVKLGCWSDWLKVKFRLGTFQVMHGMVRFFLSQVQPEVVFLASPVNFDPSAPVFPISNPAEYARELEKAIGTYATLGMVEEHTALINGRIDEEAFLAHCDLTWKERERMLLHELASFKEGMLFCLFDTPDRIQHVFWRFLEAQHPANQQHGYQEFSDVIAQAYHRCDEIVSRVLEALDERTLLLIVSDHGFGSFQRGVNLNTWLYDQGLLALRQDTSPGEEAGDMLKRVDWNRTSAYALGLGGLYLNLQGRESNGIVRPEAADQIRIEICAGLTGLKDPERGGTAIRSALNREQVYQGPFLKEAPDMLVNFAPGYRASWSTSLGGIPIEVFEDNTRRWSGDHVIDPALIPGVLLMNQPFDTSSPRMLDMAPTLLHAFGLPKGKTMEGDSLLQ